MHVYNLETKARIRNLRQEGLTYTEIQQKLGRTIPKGTLNYICKDIVLSSARKSRIRQLVKSNATAARKAAVKANRRLFDDKLANYRANNEHLARLLRNRDAQLIALATLYLGEGAKWQGSRAPRLGSTDPNIVCLYINLLIACYGIQIKDLRARIQCRADQDQSELISYWSKITNIEENKFYPCYIDKRTIGKPTKKLTTKGYVQSAVQALISSLNLRRFQVL